MTATAPAFRQVCQFTGSIAEPPETSDAESPQAAPERPAAGPHLPAAGQLSSP